MLRPVIFLFCGITFAQVNPQNRSLLVNGQAGQAPVVQINGRSFVELQALTRIAHGSVNFRNNQIVVTLPVSAASVPPESTEPVTATKSDLSRDFKVAGIETISQMREWATTLAYAIQHSYGVTEGWVAGYREKAAGSLQLASAAASTEADKNALSLLNNEFESVQQWSTQLVQAKESMDTAKYVMSPNALKDDPLSQKIITCGRFLGAMLASGNSQDDGSCH